MAHVHHDPRTKPVPEELRELVRDRLRRLGPRGAAAELNLGRSTVLSIAAGGDVLPGTLALLREATRSVA
ncbi:MAG: hypothetical protein ACOY0T_09565 [Myxococcota bacterium]